MYATIMDHSETVEFLLEKGADANAKDLDGDTALLIAVTEWYPQVIKLLLGADADVNVRDAEGRTVLQWAELSGHAIEIVPLLLEKGADPNTWQLGDVQRPLQRPTISSPSKARPERKPASRQEIGASFGSRMSSAQQEPGPWTRVRKDRMSVPNTVPGNVPARVKYVGFCFPCVVRDGLILGLKDRAVRALWRYTTNSQELERIAELPIQYSIDDLKIVNPDEYAYHEIGATQDGQYVYLRIDFNKGGGDAALHIPRKHFVLNTKTKEWYGGFKSDDLVTAYIAPGTHTLVFMRNYTSNGEKSRFGMLDFDTHTELALFDFPNTSPYTNPTVISEKGTDWVLFNVIVEGIPLLGFWNMTEQGQIAILGRPGMGELQFCSERFFTADGKYAATNRCILELIGPNIQARLLHILDARTILRTEPLCHQCIGWSVSGDLVAFFGRYSAVTATPDGGTSDVYADYVPEKASPGGVIRLIPSLSVYSRAGEQKLKYREVPWRPILFAQWYDKDSILFQAGNSIMLIRVTDSTVRPLLQGVTLKTSQE